MSSPYPLTGTASEAVLKGYGSRAKWIGRGKSPRLLAGIEMSLTLEKHRHLKPGTRTTQAFVVADAAAESSSRRVVETPVPARRLEDSKTRRLA